MKFHLEPRGRSLRRRPDKGAEVEDVSDVEVLEDRLAAAFEAKKRNNKFYLWGIALLMVGTALVAVANVFMQNYEHAERLACMHLRATQPNADCGTGFKASTYTEPATTPSADQQSATKADRTIYLTAAAQEDLPAMSADEKVRVCAQNDAKNLCLVTGYNLEGGTLTGSCGKEGGGAKNYRLSKGSCGVISKGAS